MEKTCYHRVCLQCGNRGHLLKECRSPIKTHIHTAASAAEGEKSPDSKQERLAGNQPRQEAESEVMTGMARKAEEIAKFADQLRRWVKPQEDANFPDFS